MDWEDKVCACVYSRKKQVCFIFLYKAGKHRDEFSKLEMVLVWAMHMPSFSNAFSSLNPYLYTHVSQNIESNLFLLAIP